MRDKLLIIEPIPQSEYYEEKSAPPGGWPERRGPSVKSENKLHGNVRMLVREKDLLIQQGNANAKALETEKKWRRWMITALLASWSAIIYVLKLLIPYALKGMLSH
jgi:hypothetical protein